MVTNGASDAQREKIDRFELAPLFDAVLVEGEFGAGKPDPAVYAEALRLVDVAAEQAAMVGDNLVWDVLGAQRCGMQGIWIDRQVRGLPDAPATRPDGVVRTLEQLAREL
jgi:putative hydrolase of the HAD superfamily